MKIFSIIGWLTAVILVIPTFNDACTGIKLIAKDGNAIHGRTLEFGVDVETSIAFIPQDYAFTATTPNGNGMSYKAKYAAVGAMCYDYMLLMDGINEKGLSIGSFYFPGYAGYTPTTSENQNRSLSPIDFSNWILTQFGTLEEIKNHLSNVVIAPTVIEGWGNTPPPFHYIVYDKKGQSIVLEPINGKIVVYDNPLGILTNSPQFNWHMTNLANFINLSPNNVNSLKLEDVTLAPFGQGSGMLGLPGDFTPPSRFVRAAVFSASAIPAVNAKEAIFQAFHILNQFDIPFGAVRSMDNGTLHSDYTLATVARDPISLKYYIKTYEDQTIKMVDLNAFDKKGPNAKRISTVGRQSIVDISNELKNVPKHQQ